MAKKGGSKMFWIIGGLVVIAGGIGAYFLLRKPKGKDGESFDESETGGDETGGDETGGGQTSVSNVLTTPQELNSTDKIKAFQDWMDAQGKGWIQKDGKWVLLNKGAGYGNYGKSTNAVWKVYGKQYLDAVKDGSANIPAKLKPFVDRNVISKNGIIDSKFGKYVPYTFKSKNGNEFNIQFLETGYFKVLYPQSLQKKYGNVAYEGTFKDGGREIKITKDNYPFDSKNYAGTTFKTGYLTSTLDKLFIVSESKFTGDDKFEFSSFDNTLDINF